jgi:hypothetical protein
MNPLDHALSRKADGPPPPASPALYILAAMGFTGVSEYLDDLVAWIDAPLLDKSDITVTFFIKNLTFHGSSSSSVIHRCPSQPMKHL